MNPDTLPEKISSNLAGITWTSWHVSQHRPDATGSAL